jgi:hypothetical protein
MIRMFGGLTEGELFSPATSKPGRIKLASNVIYTQTLTAEIREDCFSLFIEDNVRSRDIRMIEGNGVYSDKPIESKHCPVLSRGPKLESNFRL